MLYSSRQETKASKTAAWGSRRCRACSARAPLGELCKTSQGPPGGLPPLRGFCWEWDGKMGTFSRTDRIGAVGQLLFFIGWAIWCQVRSLTLQPVCKVKSWVKLHSIYETLQGRKSIASHLQPLFMASHTKPLPLPGWPTVLTGSSFALCSPKHYIVKFSPTKTNYHYLISSYPDSTQVPSPPV